MINQKTRFLIYIVVGIVIGLLWLKKEEPLTVLGSIPDIVMTNSNN